MNIDEFHEIDAQKVFLWVLICFLEMYGTLRVKKASVKSMCFLT